MTALALALAMAQAGLAPQPAPPPPVGRVFTAPWLHVGVRGAVLATPGELAGAVTVQVSTWWL